MTGDAMESLIADVLAVLPDDVKLDSVMLRFRTTVYSRERVTDVWLSGESVNNAQVNIGVAHTLEAVEKLRALS